MRPIVLATDGSPCSAAAQREAFEAAKLMGAPLVVVSVAHPVLPAVGYTAYGYSDLVSQLTDVELRRLEDVLRGVAAEAAEAGIACTTISASGPAAEAICKVAEDRDARMIVVGSHGWGAGGRLVHGSVSTAVLHDAPCPVLVVRSREKAPGKAQAA